MLRIIEIASAEERDRAHRIIGQKFDKAFEDWMKRVTVEPADKLLSKYQSVHAAAESWDFKACRWMEEANQEETRADITSMQAILARSTTVNIRSTESLHREMTWATQDVKQALEKQIDALKVGFERATEIANLNALIFLCELLAKPRGKDFFKTLDGVTCFIKNQNVEVRMTSLPEQVQKHYAEAINQRAQAWLATKNITDWQSPDPEEEAEAASSSTRTSHWKQ